MPLAKIEVRKNRPPEQVQAIIEAIYLAQREALQLPAHDRQIRYIEHRPEHFHVPPGKSENYTLVEITLFAGRSIEAKRSLYQAIVKNLGALGIARMMYSSCSTKSRWKIGAYAEVYPHRKSILALT